LHDTFPPESFLNHLKFRGKVSPKAGKNAFVKFCDQWTEGNHSLREAAQGDWDGDNTLIRADRRQSLNRGFLGAITSNGFWSECLDIRVIFYAPFLESSLQLE